MAACGWLPMPCRGLGEEFIRARKGQATAICCRRGRWFRCLVICGKSVRCRVPSSPSRTRRVPVDCFAGYLAGERGLARGTIRQYLAAARLFLDGGLPGGPDLGLVTAAQVSEFVRARCVGRSPAAAGDLAWGLRSFLRFAHATGAAPADLSAAVPSMASRPASSCPRGGPGHAGGAVWQL